MRSGSGVFFLIVICLPGTTNARLTLSSERTAAPSASHHADPRSASWPPLDELAISGARPVDASKSNTDPKSTSTAALLRDQDDQRPAKSPAPSPRPPAGPPPTTTTFLDLQTHFPLFCVFLHDPRFLLASGSLWRCQHTRATCFRELLRSACSGGASACGPAEAVPPHWNRTTPRRVVLQPLTPGAPAATPTSRTPTSPGSRNTTALTADRIAEQTLDTNDREQFFSRVRKSGYGYLGNYLLGTRVRNPTAIAVEAALTGLAGVETAASGLSTEATLKDVLWILEWAAADGKLFGGFDFLGEDSELVFSPGGVAVLGRAGAGDDDEQNSTAGSPSGTICSEIGIMKTTTSASPSVPFPLSPSSPVSPGDQSSSSSSSPSGTEMGEDDDERRLRRLFGRASSTTTFLRVDEYGTRTSTASGSATTGGSDVLTGGSGDDTRRSSWTAPSLTTGGEQSSAEQHRPLSFTAQRSPISRLLRRSVEQTSSRQTPAASSSHGRRLRGGLSIAVPTAML